MNSVHSSPLLMHPEHVHNFEERLNQWVANQGFWFQLRHSVLGGGFGVKFFYQVVRMSLRICVFLVLLAIGSWGYLVFRTNSESFSKSLSHTLQESLAAKEISASPSRTYNQLEISRLGAEGGPDTFFSSLEARDIRCRMFLTDGLYGTWDPGPISISRLNADLRAGADDAEMASSMSRIIFSQSKNVFVNSIDIAKADLHWGYSPRTRGSISSSTLKMRRTESGWRLTLEGGTFSQNWLKDLEIVHMNILCEPEGLFFEEAKLRKNRATVDFSGLRVEAGERPKISGKVRIRNLDLESSLPTAHQAILSGSFSSELTVSGSTNSSDGLFFEGQVTMDGSDTISLRERIHLLKALSVVDYSRNYHRVDFNDGSFSFKSGGGGLHLSNIHLRAEDLLTLDGEIVVRLPNQDEVQSAIQKGILGSSSEIFGPSPGNALLHGMNHTDFSLKQAAKQSKRSRDGGQNSETMDLFNRLGLSVEVRKLEAEAADRLSRMLRYQGNCLITLPANAFERAPRLRQKFPVNLDIGRIPMRVPIDGYLDEITFQQAESVYEDGQR